MENFVTEDGNRPQTARSLWMRAAELYQKIAAVVLAAVPALLLLFCLAPSASALGFSAENIYRLMPDKSGIGSCAIALVVAAAFAVLFAPPLLLGAFLKKAKPVTPPFILLETCFSLALLIISAVLTGRIAALDGEVGLVTVGAAPILALVFTSLSLLCGGVYIALAFLPYLDPYGLAVRTKTCTFLDKPIKPKTEKIAPKIIGIVPYVTAAAFGLFGVATFLFFLAPLSSSVGEVVSFYQVLRAEVELPVYTGCTIAMLVFACLTVLTVFLYLVCLLSEKPAALAPLTGMCACLSLAQIILSSVVIAQVAKEDKLLEGMGLMKPGAGAILMLVFALFTFLYGVAAIVLPYVLRRRKAQS